MSSAEWKFAAINDELNHTPWKFASLSDSEDYDVLASVSAKIFDGDYTKLPEYMQKKLSEFNNKADRLTSLDMMQGLFEIKEMGNGSTNIEIREGMYDVIKENLDNKDFSTRTRGDMMIMLKMADILKEVKDINWALTVKDWDEVRRLVR